MLYAKVVLGLPIEGPFDYIVPEGMRGKIIAGCRVIVSFGRGKKVGYVVKITAKTDIKNLKSISRVIDEIPVLNKNMLLLTKKLSEYYCCSWGEAIETALPQGLRRGRAIELKGLPGDVKPLDSPSISLIHSLDINDKWPKLYFSQIKDTLDKNKSVIILLTDIPSVFKAEKIIKANFNCPIAVLYRNQPDELKTWLGVKQGRFNIVIGTRSSIFAPLNNLGLVIIENEQAYGYKQDQMPHYHAREVGFMRVNIEKAKLILGSVMPSLESFNLAKKGKIEYKFIPRGQGLPEIKVCDMKGLPVVSARKNIILSKYLADSIFQVVNSVDTVNSGVLQKKGKVLLFLDRLGFATAAFCFNCGMVLKCERCSVNLVFYYKENTLRCHHCNFKMSPPKICPNCSAGYIRYSGAGTEKIESELSRIFPQARVKQLNIIDNFNIDEAEIFISTQAIIKEIGVKFDLIGVLGIDNSLNHMDFRAGEKACDILFGLIGLTDKKIIIQTSLPRHFVFTAFMNNNARLFYDEELKQRRELNFPPYSRLAIIKLRGRKEDKVESNSKALFDNLNKKNDLAIEFLSVNPSYPLKLRGNFCWQILVRSTSAVKISRFLKTHLKNFPHSGIIITVDVDPV